MAKAIYVGVAGVARKVKTPYIGVGDKARKVKKGYIGVNGVARQFFALGDPISTLAVGSTVKLNVQGTSRDFIVVQQGNPDSYFYDSSCDGTWLMMKDIFENAQWESTRNNAEYGTSDIHNYVNTTFLSYLDSNIQNIIKQVKIPYVQGSTSKSVKFGANGLSTKVFLLGAKEVGFSGSNMLDDGLVLDYFDGSAASKKIAYKNGTATSWWTRSPVKGTSASTTTFCVSTSGGSTTSATNVTNIGVRPVIILPSGTHVSNGEITG